jgi:hypothetical protein
MEKPKNVAHFQFIQSRTVMVGPSRGPFAACPFKIVVALGSWMEMAKIDTPRIIT